MKFLRIVALASILTCSLAFSFNAGAQFKSEAFSQSYNSSKTPNDTIDKLFTFKNYFRGIAHKDSIKIGQLFGGSFLIIGGEQIYNRQYWKLPIVYGTIGTSLGLGIHFDKKGNYKAAKWCYIGAGVAYWGTLMDGIVSYKTDRKPHPGKSTIYSILVPGLGQAYNREYWKIPIYDGLLLTGGYFIGRFNSEYVRYRTMYNDYSTETTTGTPPESKSTAQYYRNKYRRYRDYAIAITAGLYILQVIDANVFAYMKDFNVSDDITMSVSPAIMPTGNQYASNSGVAYGMGINLKF